MRFKKSIFEYDNYRTFLGDVYEKSKAEDKKFSFRFFSRIAGFQSPNFLKLIIDGERNLALPSAQKLAQALKLNKEETLFFTNLVLFNQATTSDEKHVYAQELMQSRTYKKLHPLAEYQLNYLTTWYYVPVRELVSLPGFKEDPAWIARHVYPNITPTEASKAIDEILKLGLLEKDPASGKLIQTKAHVTTSDEVVSACAAQYHRQMLEKASEAIDRFPRDKRELSATAFILPAENVKIVKELIQKFRREIIAAASTRQGADRVYQLNFQFFPLAATTDEES